MNTTGRDAVAGWIGLEVFDAHGVRVGRLSEIYRPAEPGRAALALVKTGLFGLRSSFVPLDGAALEDDAVVLPFDKAVIREAPALARGGPKISADEESAVYRHYGLDQPHTGA
jgi:hypothetical protein